MTENHPITPPPELVQQWVKRYEDGAGLQPLFYSIFQAGADRELEVCCALMDDWGLDGEDLMLCRRPKLPSLKEQALIHFESYAASFETSGGDSDLIRRALEQLPE
jgi:hypothetical protein